jgi:hypothetical protein
MVVDQLEVGLVEDGGGVLLSNGETDGVGEALTERARRDLDTGSVVGFGVAGSDAVDLLGQGQYPVLKWLFGMLTRKFFKSSMLTL